jgi:hypothetical protein
MAKECFVPWKPQAKAKEQLEHGELMKTVGTAQERGELFLDTLQQTKL